MKKAFRVVLTLLPLFYMIAIWVMSSLPDDVILDLPSDRVDRFIKEALHLVEFAILYMLFVAALAANHKLTKNLSLVAAITACLFGVVDELHQSFVPYRSATPIDAVKDIIGVLAAYFHVMYHYFYRKHGCLTIIEKITAKK